MAILKIARMGHPVLLEPAHPVADPAAPEVARLIADMIETMEDAGGTGLAAPQVHVMSRLIVYSIDADRQRRHTRPEEDPAEAAEEDEAGQPLTVVINPEIEPLGDDMSYAWESCLSVPGFAGRVPRHTGIHITYLTPDGEYVARDVFGFHARVLQHECDHLDGVLYPMRMDDLTDFGFIEDLNKAAETTRDEEAADD